MGDTRPKSVKVCSKCGETKEFDKFIKERNICKPCDNAYRKAKRNATIIDETLERECDICNHTKPNSDFIKFRNYCKDCNNVKRRTKYENDEEYRIRVIKERTVFKKRKIMEKNKIKEDFQNEIGLDNSVCKYCNVIQPKSSFRHNRLKCKGCERDEPLDKFKRNVRTRIWIALKQKKEHTVKYLGCKSDEFVKWISTNDLNYTIENHGALWHIDHVIPLAKFDLEDEEQQLIAFNWRNTMALSVRENLAKNRKILLPQIEQHLTNLKKYHEENEIIMPQNFIDLFAKYLVAGTPLEPSLPLINGNINEELG